MLHKFNHSLCSSGALEEKKKWLPQAIDSIADVSDWNRILILLVRFSKALFSETLCTINKHNTHAINDNYLMCIFKVDHVQDR